MTTSDPFEVLGVRPEFGLGMAELERRHRELSKALHPDRYVGRPPKERQLALGRAIEVNRAFRVLKDPALRATALLERLGVTISEEQPHPPEPAFLGEILELREDLEAVRGRRDKVELKRLTVRVEERQERAERTLERRFADLSASPGGGTARALPVLTAVSEMRYFGRFLEEARAILDEWGE